MDLHDQRPEAFGGDLDSTELQDGGIQPQPGAGTAITRVLAADPSGVVVLPAGTELDAIRIDGRDLVIIGADGVRYVIPEGAIIVPQLVIGGVVIPPLNLAALLVGNEPQPAAGPPQSSGGNFASAVGPLQAAFGLGDLLPYTELAFSRPQDEEVIPQHADRDPQITVFTPDQPAGAQDATTTVAEAGLPARGGEPAGSNAAASSETASGTFVVNSPDGIITLTINGVLFTGAGQAFASPRGTLTITGFDPLTGTATFTYTLTDNLAGGTVADQFAIAVTDRDGDVAIGTLTVAVADDAPTARNDTDAIPSGSYAIQTGNVISGAGTTSGAAGADTPGADGAAISRIASNAVPGNAETSFDAGGNLQVAGQYGTLTMRADGSYGYARNPGTPGGVSDAFTYTLTDADGSSSTATLTIAIADAAPVITSVPPANDFAAGTLVFEAGLPPRTGEAPGTSAAAPSETTSGTVTFTGGDGPVSATINGVTVAPGATVVVPGVGALTINSFDPATGAITYTFTLADNTAGDATSVTFNVIVTDVDGDAAPGTFAIAIRDDAPIAVNDSANQARENASVTVNLLGNDAQGADSVQPGAAAIVAGTLTGHGTLTNNADGTATYTPAPGEVGTVTFDYTITDGDGDVSRATATIALLADSVPTLALAGDSTVDEAALPARGAEPAGSNAASPDETATGTIAIATGGDSLASLVINGVNVTAGGTVTSAKGTLTVVAAAGGYSYSYTLTDNTLADPDSDTFTVVVTDSDGDTASTSLVVAIADDRPSASDDRAVQPREGGAVTIDVLANDTRGADGVGSNAVAAVAGSLTGKGTLVYNGNGTFTYTAAPGEQGTITFDYTITDGDGDSAKATVTITLADDSTPVVSVSGDNSVDERALPARGAEPAGSNAASPDETATGTIAIATGGDSLASLVINGVNVTAGGTVTTAKGTLTVSLAAGLYSYSYTLADNTLSDPDTDVFNVVVTDSDGDSASTELVISIADDVPTARDDGPVSPAEDTAVVIDVLANDTRGADGVLAASAVTIASAPTKGTVVYNGDGTFTYTPSPGQEGADSFAYTIVDGDGDSSTATVAIVLAPDSAPTISLAGDDTVSEAALSARGSEPAGSNAASPDETAAGTIAVAAGKDAVASLVINGQDVTGGGVVTTAKGALTVSAAAGAYSYSYTLADNTLSDPDSDTFAVVVADSDGDTANASLVIAIADDRPSALDDAGTVAAGSYGPITGNVRANDTPGADGAVVVSYSGVTSGAAGSPIEGQYGILVIAADGSYSYARNAGTPGGVSDTFSYVIQDGDGDQASARLVIAITDSGTTLTLPPALTPGVTQVFEAGLGTATVTGSAAAGNGEFASGSFTFTAPDGPATITIAGIAVTAVGQTFAGAAGTLTITGIGGGSIGYTYELKGATAGDATSDTFTVRVTDRDGEFSQSDLTVAIVDDVPTARDDPAAGAFDVAEQTPLLIGALANDTAGADGVALGGAVTITGAPSKGAVVYNGDGTFTYTPAAGLDGADSFTYSITDGDGDTSTATVRLNLLADSTPSFVTASDPTVDEDGFAAANLDAAPLQSAPQETDGNESLVDSSGVAVFDFKADVPAVLAGSAALVDTPALDGQLVTLDNQAVLFGLEGGALVGRAAGIEVIRIALSTAAPGPGAGKVSYGYTVTLSQPVKHAVAGTEDLVTLSGVTIAVTDADGDTTSGAFAVTVRDDVPTALNEAGGTLAEGATVTGTFDFVAGADSAKVTAVNGTALVFGADGFSQAISLLNGAGTVVVGSITVKADGTYSLTAANPLTNPVDAVGTFTVTDRDGDSATANIAFTVTDANAPTGGAAAAAVDDDGLAGGNPASTINDLDANAGDAPTDTSERTFTGTLVFTAGGDMPATVAFAAGVNGAFAQVGLERVEYTVAGNVLTAKVAATDAGGGVQARSGATLFTVEITNAATGAFKVTLISNVLHAGGPNDENSLAADAVASIAFTVTDADGSTAAASLAIRFDDDAPTATAAVGTQAAENQPVTIDITSSFAAGADGVNLAQVTHSAATQGMVSYNGAGLFTYTPNAGAGSGGNTTDSFTYTVTDGDGDTATATVTIILKPDSAPVANDVAARIDDDGLAAGNPASITGDDNQNAGESGAGTASEAVWTGSMAVQPGANDTPLIYTLASAAGSGTVGTEAVDFTWDSGTSTLTATVAAAQARTGTVLFTVKVDNASTGAYTVTLINPIAHAPLTGTGDDDTENNASVSLTYTVSDSDSPADSDTGLITIDFDDDTPSASAIAVTQPVENTPFDIPVGGSFNAGADGLASITFTNPAQGTLALSGSTFTYTPNAGAGSPPAGTSDSFTYTVTDKDGDSVTRTVSITLQGDSTPAFKTATNLAVDEDGLPTANGDNGQANPLEVTGSNSPTDTSGRIVFDFKADLPSSLGGSAVLVDTGALDGQLKTLANEDVVFRLEGADLVGRAGTFAGPEVIRIALGGATNTPPSTEVTYAYSVTLSQPVKHAITGSEDLATLTGVTIEVTDRDGDKATGTFDVTVRDDVPSLDVTKGADGGVLLATQDAETDGSPTHQDTAVAAVGAVTAGFAGVFALTSTKGADGGADPALSYALNVTSAASLLKSHGADIKLYKVSDSLIVGSTAAANPGGIDGSVVFSVAVAADGTVTLVQYQQIDHAPEASPLPGTDAPFDDQFISLDDGLITLTASASLTDGDGDVASDSETVSIGANLRFFDDGPVLTAVAAGAGVTLDETGAGVNFASPISSTSASAVITATAAFGADGPFGNTAAAATAYALELAGSGATALKTAIGDFPISLVKTAANTVEGRYTDGTTKTAFVLTIGSDGKLTVEQRVALEHTADGNTAADYDDPLDLAGLVNATITITDFDGDTASASTGIGSLVVFEDDGVDAVADTGSVPAGSSAQISGNVLANDYRGADGSTITAVVNTAAGTTGTLASGVLTIQGLHGVLKLTVATGAYTYDRTPGAGGGGSDVFSYTLTDNDGDFDTATLTIAIGDARPVAGTADATVDDEGLPGGIAGGAGDIDANTPTGRTADLDPASSEAVFKGTLAGTPGDSPTTFFFAAGLSGTTQMLGQETVTYTVGGTAVTDGPTTIGGLTLTATGPWGVVFTITITNPATGAYTLELKDNVRHAAGGSENDVDIVVPFQMRDADGDLSAAPGSLSIKFDDDLPVADVNLVAGATLAIDETDGFIAFNEIDPLGGNLGVTTLSAASFLASAHQAGADGIAATAYALNVSSPGVASGYIDSASNQSIVLVKNGSGVVEGRVNSAAGPIAFTVAIDAATGQVTFAQYRGIRHTNTASTDEPSPGMAAGVLTLSVEITDDDGDKSSDFVDLGSIVRIEDDGAILGAFQSGTLPNAVGTVSGTFQLAAGSDGIQNFTIGGPALTGVTYSSATSTSASGIVTTTLTATADPDGAGPLPAVTLFTLAVNSDGTYSFNLVTPQAATTQTLSLTSLRAGGPGFRELDDNLATTGVNEGGRIEFTSNGTGVNATSNDFGVSNTDVDPGEFFVAEFHNPGAVGDDPANSNPEFLSAVIFNINTLRDSPGSEPGSRGPNATVRWTATNTATGATESGTVTVTSTGPLLIDPSISFNQIRIENFNDPALTNDGARFSISSVTISKTILPQDQNLDFPITATDRDGDTTAAQNLDVQITASSGSAFSLAGDRVANDNDAIGSSTIADTITGGGGFDVADYSDSSGAISINLDDSGNASGAPVTFASPANGTIGGGDAAGDTLVGIEGLRGGAGNDVLFGNAGANVLVGNGGNDTLNGEGGADVLIGGAGLNTLTGGAGTDVFVIDASALTEVAQVDVITDYAPGEIIDLTGVLNLASNLDAVSGGYLRYTTTGALQVDATGGGDGWITVAQTSTPAASATVRYQSGSTTTTVVLSPVAPPIVLDLDGDGVEFVGSSAGALFDYRGDGEAVTTAWAGADDGILALDINGNGRVDDGAEIVFAFDGKTDLEGLAARYDSNADGVLDARDAAYSRFGVWQDVDGDGASDPGEFRLLSEVGIVSLSLTSDGKAYSAANGEVRVAGTGTFVRADGTIGKLADAAFATGSRNAQRTAELVATTAVAGALADAALDDQLGATQLHRAPAPAEWAAPRTMAGDSDDGAAVPAESPAAPFPALHHDLGRAGEAIAHFRGETSASRLLEAGELDLGGRSVGPGEAAEAAPRVGAATADLLSGFGGDAVMQALLAIPPGGTETGASTLADAAILSDALSDLTGQAMLDSLVDHYAAPREGPAFAFQDGRHDLDLLSHGLAGSGYAPRSMTVPDAIEDMQALIAAQA